MRITHFAHTFQHPVHTFPNLVHTDSPSFAPCYHLYQKYAKSVNKVWFTHFGHTFCNLVHTFGVLFTTMYSLFPTLYTLIVPVLHFVIGFIKSTPKVWTKPEYDLHTLETLFSILYNVHTFFDQNISSVPKVCNKICKRPNHATTPRHHVSSMLPGSGLWAESRPILRLNTAGDSRK